MAGRKHSQTYHPGLDKDSHLSRILDMANAPKKQEEEIDARIGRPRLRGLDLIRDPNYSKGMCFTLQERQLLGLQGLLPPAILNQDQQERNERLFYRTIMQNVELMMPIIYTPTVIVVTDGERILGLGDLGAYGMGIPVGKLALYTALAGVPPHRCLPILIDVGTDNENLMKDPLYIGLKQKRERGSKYDALLEEYGGNCLIQFEDFGNHNAFRLLEKYRDSYCSFNDDIQGTAAVAVAGLMASLNITGKSLKDNVFMFQGAGEASIGIAKLLIMALEEQGSSRAEAYSRIWMVDSRGLIVKDRPAGGVTGQKVPFAQDHAPIEKLEDVIKQIKPTAIIGAAAQPGAFTETVLRDMAEFNERPIIFALSNPTSKAECTAEQAYTATDGKCVFASGSPFRTVTLGERTFHPGQGNNAYVFPAVGLATVACDIRTIPEIIFLESAKALAALVTKENLSEGRVYPPLSDIRDVSTRIAVHLAEFAYRNQLAYHFPEPQDKARFIHSHQYEIDYENYIPPLYDWPGHSTKL
ncbi:MAOX-like protein [Mya arenaria]|uniref:Malic enzyme n=1 Tax=Mya arenaria TaxID=6604 RepID=A0ABY7EFT5_MYAAR|nr:MAOX-like protein [Mya arenaria]